MLMGVEAAAVVNVNLNNPNLSTAGERTKLLKVTVELCYLMTWMMSRGIVAQDARSEKDEVAVIGIQDPRAKYQDIFIENGASFIPKEIEPTKRGKQLNPTRDIQTCLLYTSPSPRDRTRSR